MPLLLLNKRWPDGSVSSEELNAEVSQSVMQVVVAAGINEIAADCGGTLSCATCHVYVTPEWQDRLPPPGEDELAMLPFTAAERRANSRLSCQIVMSEALDGLVLELPERQY